MAARSNTIKGLLLAWLNDVTARAWPLQGWTATGNWDETLDSKDPDTAANPVVQAVMEGKENGHWITRGTWQEDFIGFIGIRQRYENSGAIADDWIDARVELLEAIEEQMRRLDLSASPYQTVIKKAPDGLAVAELRDRIDYEVLRQYTGIIEFKLEDRGPG